MSAAFAGTCGQGTDRMTGSAPGPAKVATRMVLLRMGLLGACKSYHALLLSGHWVVSRSSPRGAPRDARVAGTPLRGPSPRSWIPAISAFTRVHSPSKTGVNALNDALCAGMNGVLWRGRQCQSSTVTGAPPLTRVPPRHARHYVRAVSRWAWKVSHVGPSRFLFLLRQHPLLSLGHAHRRACFRGRRRGALAAVQPARNLDRAEQYRVHEERREDELFLARRRAARTPPQHPVRRPGAIPGRCGSPGAAGGSHRRARKMVRRLLARHISRLVRRSARARCRRSRRAYSCLAPKISGADHRPRQERGGRASVE